MEHWLLLLRLSSSQLLPPDFGECHALSLTMSIVDISPNLAMLSITNGKSSSETPRQQFPASELSFW
jgi:hypothetical protein